MKINLIVVIALMLTVTGVNGKPAPEIKWIKNYHGPDPEFRDYLKHIQESSDGGYITTGVTLSLGRGFEPIPKGNLWILKIDGEGSPLWSQGFGDQANENKGNYVVETSDGGYVVAGEYMAVYIPRDTDAWLIKMDASGNVVWDKKYGNKTVADNDGDHEYLEYAVEAKETSDKGFSVIGYKSIRNIRDSIFCWAFKTDAQGNEEWNVSFSKGLGVSIIENKEQRYIATGYNNSGIVLSEINENGFVEWVKILGEPGDHPTTVLESSKGYVVLATRGSKKAVIICTDKQGNSASSKIVEMPSNSRIINIQPDKDGGYIVSGYFELDSNNYVGMVLKLNSQAKVEWQKILTEGEIKYVKETSDGGYICLGFYYVTKLGSKPAGKATVCTVWTADALGNPLREYEGWTAYIHWDADGQIDMKILAPDGSLEKVWENLPERGVIAYSTSQKIGVYKILCTGASPHYIGKSFFIMPESELGVISMLTVMLFALILHLRRRE